MQGCHGKKWKILFRVGRLRNSVFERLSLPMKWVAVGVGRILHINLREVYARDDAITSQRYSDSIMQNTFKAIGLNKIFCGRNTTCKEKRDRDNALKLTDI